MAQIKIYGFKENLNEIKNELSNTIHQTVVKVLEIPENKRFHRFFPMEKENMIVSEEKSLSYIIIEIIIIKGRSKEIKKELIKTLFTYISKKFNIKNKNIEICIIESPIENWGFRGMCGDEINLNYNINV